MSVRDTLVRVFITISALVSFFQATTYASDKLKVAASFYPLAHFAEQVGGERVEVTNSIPPGAEPHEFEPTPRDIQRVYEAALFLFNGKGLDPWAERIQDDLEREGIIVIEIAKFFTGSNSAFHTLTDPHFWLDPVLAIQEVEIIRDALIQADPLNRNEYLQNCASYVKALNRLHALYVAGLEHCARKEIILSHDAFGYLAKRYGITTHAITGISPEEEPSLRKLAELTMLARKKKIGHIFFEELVSPKLAETIARESGAETLVLNPLGGLTVKDREKGRTYISIMEDNLRNLRTAMDCK